MNELEQKASEVAEILKLLAHPKRLLILCKLSEGEMSVGDLEKFCSISQSQLSQFLAKMRQEWLIESRKDGIFVYYRIQDGRISQMLKSLTTIYCDTQC